MSTTLIIHVWVAFLLWLGCTSSVQADFSQCWNNVQKLRLGIPPKPGFEQFLKIETNRTTPWDLCSTDQSRLTGFSIDVFYKALEQLSFNVCRLQIVPYVNETGGNAGTYDQVLTQLTNNTVDVVVGDITINAERAQNYEFTLPYAESGVVMVVPVKRDDLQGMWVFVKPFHWSLWLTVIGACMFFGVVVKLLEHHVNPRQQLALVKLFFFPLSLLAFPERNIVKNKWSRVVLVIWLFLAYIVMQSYTASLSSILTVEKLQARTNNPLCVGYQTDSFVGRTIIVKERRYNKSNLEKNYSTMKHYDAALSQGCNGGGVDAIFDELPYIKLFLHKYPSKYKMVGPTYKTGGFGFAFQLGSALATCMSRAILNVTEDYNRMKEIEENNFGKGYSSPEYNDQQNPPTSSLRAQSFAGLFIIVGFVTIVVLVGALCSRRISMLWSSCRERTSPPPLNDKEPISHFSNEINSGGDLAITIVTEEPSALGTKQDHQAINTQQDDQEINIPPGTRQDEQEIELPLLRGHRKNFKRSATFCFGDTTR